MDIATSPVKIENSNTLVYIDRDTLQWHNLIILGVSDGLMPIYMY